MKVCVRTTSGPQIGMGHLRRCLTLAGELARHAEVELYVAGDPRGPQVARDAGFTAHDDAAFDASHGDLVVVDDYALDSAQLAAIAARTPTAVIDDLADRELDVDAVINGNADALELHYRTAPRTELLLGTRFTLLRPSFRGLPVRHARPVVQRILVTLGGADVLDQTPAIALGLSRALPAVRIDVVIGPFFRPYEPAGARVVVHHAPPELAPLMVEADLAITAGGQTTYELAACGVPSVALCTAENQRGNLRALERAGTLVQAADATAAVEAACVLASDLARRARMTATAQALVDGLGAERVATALVALHGRLA